MLRNFPKLEKLKPRINKRYDRYRQIVKETSQPKAAGIQALTASRQEPTSAPNHRGHSRLSSDFALSHTSEALSAGDNRDLAVKLAHREIRRRATARKATRQAGLSDEEGPERRTAGVWGEWECNLSKDENLVDQDNLSTQMHNVRRQVNGSRGEVLQHGGPHPLAEGQKTSFLYPSVPHKSAQRQEAFSITSENLRETHPVSLPPQRPPKNLDLLADDPSVPRRPNKEEITYTDSAPRSATASPTIKPSTFTFKPSAYLENGTPLRTIFLPPDLRNRFLSIALPNTRANLETCGILCGTLISNALFISKLVIPEQESTSDTCETVNESELFDYIDGEDLMVLGWIHTHPTQTCFMSSRDLHTHSGYQVMMPESIAIVCAPSKGE